jgi:hypothetical protein
MDRAGEAGHACSYGTGRKSDDLSGELLNKFRLETTIGIYDGRHSDFQVCRP